MNSKIVLVATVLLSALTVTSLRANSQESTTAFKGSSQEGGYLRSNVIYNQPQTRLRLSRITPPGAASPKPALSQSDANAAPTRSDAGAPAAQSVGPTAPSPPGKLSPLEKQTPVSDVKTAQNLLRQSLDATFYACDYLILTGVNSRQFTIQEELDARSEMDNLAALNKSYAAQGYTKDTFNEIQRKLVVLQLHLYTYGQNAATRQ